MLVQGTEFQLEPDFFLVASLLCQASDSFSGSINLYMENSSSSLHKTWFFQYFFLLELFWIPR
jgi:hypothetical protein